MPSWTMTTIEHDKFTYKSRVYDRLIYVSVLTALDSFIDILLANRNRTNRKYRKCFLLHIYNVSSNSVLPSHIILNYIHFGEILVILKRYR
jgi:hypothetical protein